MICLFVKRSKRQLEGSLVSLFWLLLSLKNELLSFVISLTGLLFEILFKDLMLARASFLFHPRKWRRKVLSDYLIIKILKAMIASWRSTFLAKLSILLFIIWRVLGIDSLKLRIDIIESYFIDIPWLCCTTSHFIAAKFKDQICKLCILNNFWEYKRFYWFHSYSSSFFPAKFTDPSKASPNSWIEMILDRIVSSSLKKFRYLFPFTAIFSMSLKEHLIVCDAPLHLADCWIKMIMPSLSTLFACPLIDATQG